MQFGNLANDYHLADPRLRLLLRCRSCATLGLSCRRWRKAWRRSLPPFLEPTCRTSWPLSRSSRNSKTSTTRRSNYSQSSKARISKTNFLFGDWFRFWWVWKRKGLLTLFFHTPSNSSWIRSYHLYCLRSWDELKCMTCESELLCESKWSKWAMWEDNEPFSLPELKLLAVKAGYRSILLETSK